MWRGAPRRASGKAMQIAEKSTSFTATRIAFSLEIGATALTTARTLEVELCDKLDGAGTCGGRAADARDGANGCGIGDRRVWRPEVWMVEGVERLAAELQAVAVTEAK